MPRRVANAWLVDVWTISLGALGVILGIALIAGGPDRFSGASFATARLVPGEHITWGALILAAGAVVVTSKLGRRHDRTVSLAIMAEALWFLFFGLSFARTALDAPTAALTGIATYAFAAFVCIALAVSLRSPTP